MEKWFIGISGLILTMLIAVNDISVSLAIVTLICSSVILIRNREPSKVCYRLILWGVMFAMLSVLCWEYLYKTHVVDLEAYASQRQLLARGFIAISTVCAMLYCIYKDNVKS